MFVSEFACPCCGTIIQPANPVAVGRKVQCYACRTTFVVAAEREDPSPPRAASVPSGYPVQIARDDWIDEERLASRPVRKQFRPKRQGPNIGLIAFLITGSIALVLVVVLVLIVTLRPSGGGQVSLARRPTPPGWQDVVSTEGRFRIFMPGSPKTGDSVVHTRLGSLSVKAYDVDSGDCQFSVFYGDLDSNDLRKVSPEEWIDAVRDIYIARSKAILLDEKILSFQGQFGKETRYEIPALGKVARRMFAIKRRIYTLNFAAKKQDSQEDVIARFFDSFEILAGSPKENDSAN